MKIDIIFYDLEKKAGIQKAIADLMSELTSHQDTDLRLILFEHQKKFSFQIPQCVDVLFLGIPEAKSQYRIIELVKKLIWAIRSRKKITHATLNTDLVIDMGTMYGLLSNNPKVVLYRHFDPFINIYNRILFKVMKIVTDGQKEIIVLCQAYKNKLMDYGYKKVYVIGNFPSNNFKKQFFDKNQPLKALIIGRYSKQKNQKFIVNALSARVSPEPIDISFYGEGNNSKLKSQVSLSNRITFNGPVDSPYNLIDGNTIVISSSKYEGLPIFILESLNTSAILVCSDIVAHKYMLGEKFYGYYQSNNINSFNKVLDKIVCNIKDDLIRQKYLAINEEILRRFTKEKYSREVSNFLNKRRKNG